ncbi:MAG: hypothetical protein ACOZAR_03265 [Patescibacteria group bacterium]
MVNHKISFKANEVSYQEENGGDIIQIIFNEEITENQSDELNSISKPYFSISQDYEFSSKPTIEWFDGKDFDGGADLKGYNFTACLFEVKMSNGLLFSIEHACSQKVFKKIDAFLKNEFPNRKLEKL